jgi:NAD(P)H-hydrate epimerase
LRKLRPAFSDKRSNGHLFLLAGSRDFAGAAMMAAQGALKAGVGLLTVGVPESLHAAFAAQRPEAMWIPLPETPEGTLALEGLGKVRSMLPRATALVAGPGLGSDAETCALVRETLSHFNGPVLLDADALRPEILEKESNPGRLVLTPHAGEFQRIASGLSPHEYNRSNPSVLVLKGSHTQVFQNGTCYHSPGGSSVLARGGSGDLLAGILGALLAKGQYSSLDASILGVQWHGRAGEVLARQHGQEAIFTTEVLNYLSFAIRNDF